MEKMAVGQCVEIFLTGEEAVTNLPQTLRLEGHTVVDLSPVKGGSTGLYRLVVETGSTCAD